MAASRTTLSREEARAYYDRFGAKQDKQGFYEDAPLTALLEHGRFGEALAVGELGCGTGRFAERLLSELLPPSATYRGFDLSETMVELAARRLARFAPRARVALTDGAPRLPVDGASLDRWVSSYVLDLLAPEDVEAALRDARRSLRPGGLLCVAGLTTGATWTSRATSGLWSLVHWLSPRLVGGCRPLRVVELLSERDWRVDYHRTVIAAGIPSEVLVAEVVRP